MHASYLLVYTITPSYVLHLTGEPWRARA